MRCALIACLTFILLTTYTSQTAQAAPRPPRSDATPAPDANAATNDSDEQNKTADNAQDNPQKIDKGKLETLKAMRDLLLGEQERLKARRAEAQAELERLQALHEMDPADIVPDYTPSPLSDIIARHEKTQKFSVAILQTANDDEMRKVLRDDYLAHGSRSEKWDESMLAAIDETLRCLSADATFPQRHKLIHMLRSVARNKCDDFRYWYMYAYARRYDRTHDVLVALEKAVTIAEKTPEQNRHMLWLLNLRYSQMLGSWRKEEEAAKRLALAREHFVIWVEQEAPAYGPALVMDWTEYFVEMSEPAKPLKNDEAASQAFVDSVLRVASFEPWIPHMLGAKIALRRAWRGRGGGWARDVTEDGWRIWRQQTQIAFIEAQKAHALNPNQPMAASMLVELCWGEDESQGKEFSSRYWFEQATAAMIDYEPAYSKYAWGIMPRWGGSTRMLMNFAKECTDTQRYDIDIPSYALNILHNVTLDYPKEEPAPKPLSTLVAGQVANIFTHYIAAEKDPVKRKHLNQYWIGWTKAMDMPDQAVIAHSKLESPYDPNLGYNKGEIFGVMTQYELDTLLARTQPMGDKLTEAIHAEYYKQDWYTAKKIYTQLTREKDIDPAITRYAADRLQTNQWQTAYDMEEWVDLEFSPNLTGFKTIAGQWERIDQQTVQGTTDQQPMRLQPMIELGRYYEIEFTVRVINKARGPALMAGLVYNDDCQPTLYQEYGLYVRHDQGSIWSEMGFYEPFRAMKLEIPEIANCKITVNYSDMGMAIDGEEVRALNWVGYYGRGLVPTLGTAFEKAPGNIVQFSNIRVHKLPKPEPVIKATPL